MTRIHDRARRQGYTLIELLVVIAIIAVLVSLTSAAVMKFFGKGPEAQARADIDQMSQAAGNFKAAFENAPNFPSLILLSEDGQYTNAGTLTTGMSATSQTQLMTDSKNFLAQIFGSRCAPSTTNQINWNGDNSPSGRTWLLTGDQCLVFFLGGIPVPGTTLGCQGFSTSPTNPATPGGTRKGPFFEFKSSRLSRGGNGFLSYLDPWGKQPYLYFSSYKTNNGYNRYLTSANAIVSDCSQLSLGAYFQSSTASGTNFYNPTGFQIISAGPDGAFGQGGLLNPATGNTTAGGMDDFSNFSKSRLGTQVQ